MGFLDNIEKQLGGTQPNAVLQSVAGLITNNGGLSGLIDRCKQSGLAQHVESWVGHGQNLPITGDHVGQVFGANQVQQVAQQLGTDPNQASGLIAKVLPEVIDKLTPKGQVVSNGEAQQGLSALLSKGLGALFAPKPPGN